jgi:hypothetical protein
MKTSAQLAARTAALVAVTQSRQTNAGTSPLRPIVVRLAEIAADRRLRPATAPRLRRAAPPVAAAAAETPAAVALAAEQAAEAPEAGAAGSASLVVDFNLLAFGFG